MSWLSAFVLFLVILYLLFALVNSSLFHVRYTFGTLCVPSSNASVLDEKRTVPLDISKACFATGIKLEAGKTYHFSVSDSLVYDGEDNEATANGVKEPSAIMYLFIPLRRHVTEAWIKLFGRISNDGNDNFVLDVGKQTQTARSDGELFLYVNDAVFGVWSKWDLPYTWEGGLNKGIIEVTIDVDKTDQESLKESVKNKGKT